MALAQDVSRESDPIGPAMKLGGSHGLVAATPVVFLPLAVVALTFENAPLLSIGVTLLAIAPLFAAACISFTRPLAARTFAASFLVFALSAAWIAWTSGGVLSPATPWVFAGLAGVAMLGGAVGAVVAAITAVAIAIVAVVAPEPPVRLMGFAPRVEREAIAAFSWAFASASTIAVAWAAGRAARAALPPLRHPTIAARKALSMLAEGAAICGLRITQTNHIAQVLGAPERTLEFERDELRSLSLEALSHPDDISAIDGLRKAALSVEEPTPVTIRMRSRLGGYRWLEATAMGSDGFPPPDSGGGASDDVILLLRDRWRKGGEAQPAAEFDRAGFLAHMGADLKNAAKSIVGFTDILKNELFGPLGAERYRDYARLANEGGLELMDRIEELLDLANIEAGRYAARTDSVEIGPLVDGAIRLVRQRGEAAGVALSSEVAVGATSITIDRRALRRVLQAMLLDAVRRVHVGDAIRLDAAVEDGAVRFAVVASVQPRGAGDAAVGATTRGAAKDWPAHSDGAAERETASLAEARLGRMVAASLSDVLGGTLFFVDETADDETPLPEGDTLVAEAIMPLAPKPALQDDLSAPTPVAAIEAPVAKKRARIPSFLSAGPETTPDAAPAAGLTASALATPANDDFVATEIETASLRDGEAIASPMSGAGAASADQAALFADAELPKIEAESAIEPSLGDDVAARDGVTRFGSDADTRDAAHNSTNDARNDADMGAAFDAGGEDLPLFDLSEPDDDADDSNASWDDTDRTRSRIRRRLRRRLPA